jgi:hypothetical protein
MQYAAHRSAVLMNSKLLAREVGKMQVYHIHVLYCCRNGHTGYIELTQKQTPLREKAHGTALLSVRLNLHSRAVAGGTAQY